MKKYIKFLIIALLVIAAVTVTCYIFFNKLNKTKSEEVSLTEFLYSEAKDDLKVDLNYTINEIVNSDDSDFRFNVFVKTLDRLEKSMSFLSSYYIETDGKVKNTEVAESLNRAKSYMNLSSNIMEEMNVKAFIRDNEGNIIEDNAFYNRSLGANDLYVAMSEFVKSYADAINKLNSGLNFVNKDVDIRFSIIDVYTNVVINTFSSLQIVNDLKIVQNLNNINFLNSNINWQNNFQLVLGEGKSLFSEDVLLFIKYYNLSNKLEFAKNIHSICSNLTGVVNPTNEQNAAIYFKLAFGV